MNKPLVAAVAALFVSGSALAAAPTTTTSGTPATTQPAAQHATGVVKSLDATKHTITVNVAGKDMTWTTAGVTLDPAVKAGATVDVTYTGDKASAVAVHH